MEKFGALLKNLRTSRKLSQMKLARAMGISQAFLSGIENDERLLSYDRLDNFAEFLGLTNEEKSSLTDTWYKDCGAITIDTCAYDDHQKRLLSNLFDHLENVDENQVNQIIKILNKN